MKVEGRRFVAWFNQDGWVSLYSYWAAAPDYEDWLQFFALTWTPDVGYLAVKHLRLVGRLYVEWGPARLGTPWTEPAEPTEPGA